MLSVSWPTNQSNSRKKSNPQCNTEPSKHTKTNFQPLLCPPCMQCIQNNENICIYIYVYLYICLLIDQLACVVFLIPILCLAILITTPKTETSPLNKIIFNLLILLFLPARGHVSHTQSFSNKEYFPCVNIYVRCPKTTGQSNKSNSINQHIFH